MPVSIKDIAKALGIAPSTVSRALQGVYGVKKETRSMIQKKAEELGYVVNIGARDLVRGKTNLVGVFITDDDSEARPPLFETFPTLKKMLGQHGKETIILSADPFQYKEGQYEEMCRLRSLEGSIILGPFGMNHTLIQEAKASTIPTVILSEPIIGPHCSCIGPDDEKGVYDAVKYLIELGHHRIGYVNGFPHLHICMKRFEGYRRALKEAGIPFKEQYIEASDFSGLGGALAAKSLLGRDPTLTAIMFANDLMAMGAISKLHNEGILVPRDLSVIGYDGLFIGDFYNPPLTTVQINDRRISTQIADMLIELISGESGKQVLVESTLIKRSSVRSLQS